MILLIDSYDSFANNLSRLVSTTTGKKVFTIYNDTIHPEDYDNFFTSILPTFEYVIVGPGPGHPSILKDVGIIPALFKHASREVSIPILGICLGLQCLCYAFGNDVQRLDDVKHGQIYNIHPISDELYSGSRASFQSVRYHSLYVDINKLNDSIVPLAVCHEPNSDSIDAPRPGSKQILMAARHVTYPFYGVQYHPESICSEQGDKLIHDFDALATEYRLKHGLVLCAETREQVSSLFERFSIQVPGLVQSQQLSTARPVNIKAKKLKLSSEIGAMDICEFFNQKYGSPDFLLLNSASLPGQWSIIGLPTKGHSEVLTHSVDDMNFVSTSTYGDSAKDRVKLSGTVWDFVAQKIEQRYVSRETIDNALGPDFHSRKIPFFGGYLGLFSYEEGKHIFVENLDSLCTGTTPDMKLVFVERALLFDHLTNDWFIISISDNGEWVEKLHQELQEKGTVGKLKLDADTVAKSVGDLCENGESITFDFPDRDTYKKQFQQCQDYLHSGDSYELCLTTSLKISVPSSVKAWDIYKILTLHKNPSPFSCFMSFDDVTLISSSPERFLSWKDGPNKHKIIELRPIKGTVKKTVGVDLEAAAKILNTPKEMGENLMIVDLIRHDLHAFIDDVYVSQLMSIEEYKTVFQLVSVIGGELKKNYHGIDILHHSLPPGSMTGAPKKRSVELLKEIESLQPNGSGGRRGVYSGVAGYWSVTDDSDWSVIIRSVFHYTDDKQNLDEKNVWRIGAGGAITVLSNVDDEWEEMEIKLSSALQAF